MIKCDKNRNDLEQLHENLHFNVGVTENFISISKVCRMSIKVVFIVSFDTTFKNCARQALKANLNSKFL